MQHLVVLDTHTPWVRSLFAELPDGWFADMIAARSVGLSPRRWWQAAQASIEAVSDRAAEQVVPVPGWTRFNGWSAWRVSKAIGRLPRPRAIVHTNPWTSSLIRTWRDVPHVYRPHDYFGMYSWDQRKVARHERELMAGCRLVLPISASHADDLRKLGEAPVQVLPNGVSGEFVVRLRSAAGGLPGDLVRETPPLVGCVGQINSSYDVEWLSALADGVPQATFVFVGPVFDEGPEVRRTIDALFARSNVRWIGPKPHQDLPQYLRAFDVCLIPLRANHANDRRSPLRLFDYLATDNPILSTGVVASRERSEHIAVGATPTDAVRELSKLLMPGAQIDVAARRAYVERQTWAVRAAELVAAVNSVVGT